ncbi:MAG: zinc ribbon domain-containing protein [Vicinamibacteria bacterium]
MTLLFLAALAAGVVLFILFPVFARYGEVSMTPTADARKRKDLTEQKERLYDAIKDLDFEHRAGKLSDADYQKVRSDLVSQAAAIIAQLDEVPEHVVPAELPQQAQQAQQAQRETPAESSADVTPPDEPTCASCGQVNPAGARFCFQCGERIAAPASCPECGTELPKEARYCTSCGVAMPA